MNSGNQRRACEFQLLRYVPDAVRNEYVHIGVILRETGTADESGKVEPGKVEPGKVEVRFTRDWRRVRCLDPDADTALLEGMEGELRRRLQVGTNLVGTDQEGTGLEGTKLVGTKPEERGRGLMRILEESLSLNVQMTEPKAYLAESVPQGREELRRVYVEPPPRERSP